ncbi:nmrA-like family domain-containing protein 1 [Diadema antillarum]|uniref:nmrA-like family domain-containing protein 1 n=1 Tax=Diadema antillarum TaxID=105358 RepID=UPI003A88E7AC
MPNLITVFGATGSQAGSLVEALLEDGSFAVRGVSRSNRSEAAIALQAKGIEMVVADYDEPESLTTAMMGSYGVYAVTGNYLEKFDEEREVLRGRALIQAAIQCGVQHFVFSGLQSVREAIGQPCPEFDGKAKVENMMFKSGLRCTSVRFPVYMENILRDFIPVRQDDASYVWNIPMEGKPLPMICASQAGQALLAVFKKPEHHVGWRVGLAGDYRTMAEYAAIASKHVAPLVIKASQITAEDFKKLDLPRATDLGVMFQFYQTAYPEYSVDDTKRLFDQVIDFDEFMSSNAPKLLKLLENNNYSGF